MGYTWVCHCKLESKRQTTEWKHTDSPVKNKFCTQQSVKKVMLTVFWYMKGPITIDFLEKCATVNNATYGKHDSKKKFWEQWSVKKGMLTVF